MTQSGFTLNGQAALVASSKGIGRARWHADTQITLN